MIRVCPKRDGECPHGVACPYSIDRYSCKDEPARGTNPLSPEPAPVRAELIERTAGNLAPGWELEFIDPRAKGGRVITWTINPATLFSDIEKKLSFGLLLWSIRPVAELRALAASDEQDKRIAALEAERDHYFREYEKQFYRATTAEAELARIKAGTDRDLAAIGNIAFIMKQSLEGWNAEDQFSRIQTIADNARNLTRST